MARFATSASDMLPPDPRCARWPACRPRGAAHHLGGDLLRLGDGIRCRGVRGPRHRVRRLAAAGDARPRKVLRGVAPGEDDLVPRHAHHLGGDAVHVEADSVPRLPTPGLDVHLAVRLDDEQAVEADRPGDEAADRDADAAHLGAHALADRALRSSQPKTSLPFQRFLDERAGRVALLPFTVGRAELRLALGRVEPADGHLIDPSLRAPPGHHRLEDHDPAARPAGSARAAAACWSAR